MNGCPQNLKFAGRLQELFSTILVEIVGVIDHLWIFIEDLLCL